MKYRELCKKMADAGWLSHIIAACNTDHRHGSSQKHFTARLLSGTKTGQAFHGSRAVPKFKRAKAVPATLHFHDERGWHDDSVLVDRQAGLFSRGVTPEGKPQVGYLDDIPLDRIAYQTDPLPVGDLSHSVDFEAEELSAQEGSSSLRQHLDRERHRGIVVAKRRQILAAGKRLVCEVCTLDFERVYGSIGANFCEVHHRRPLGDGKTETRLTDLAVVCSNCHRMLHRQQPLLEIGELRAKIPKSWLRCLRTLR